MPHGVDNLADDLAAAQSHLAGGTGQPVGLPGVVGVLPDGRAELLHRRGRLFQRAGLLLGTP